MTARNLHHLRKEYILGKLEESSVSQNPIIQFSTWFSEAEEAKILEPNAFVLSTVNAEHKPSSRVLLLKSFHADGFTFFTNYSSRKGQEITQNPNACMLFFWGEIQRQIRIEGVLEKISEEESEIYFNSRPLGSQIGAMASPQSHEITRTELEQRVAELEQKKEIKKPENWGGYILKPTYFEFWQGRASRLHDRISYKKENQSWKISRLAP